MCPSLEYEYIEKTTLHFDASYFIPNSCEKIDLLCSRLVDFSSTKVPVFAFVHQPDYFD